MKLILATIQDQDADVIVQALNAKKFRVTRIGSTGGFLHQGNTTLLSGVEDHEVDSVLATLGEHGHRRTQLIPSPMGAMPNGMAFYNYVEVPIGGATVFILDVEHFEQV